MVPGSLHSSLLFLSHAHTPEPPVPQCTLEQQPQANDGRGQAVVARDGLERYDVGLRLGFAHVAVLPSLFPPLYIRGDEGRWVATVMRVALRVT
jgi:hypothetical protein